MATHKKGAGFTTVRVRDVVAKELRVHSIRSDRDMTDIVEEALQDYGRKYGLPMPQPPTESAATEERKSA